MIRLRSIAALAAVASMLAATPAFAMEKSMGSMGSMKGASSMADARFGGSVYKNNPKLTNTLALVEAGGGPSNFSTVTLFGVLAGPVAAAEQKKLVAQFGKAGFAQYVKTFDFVVADSLKIVTAAKVKLPAAPSPDPTNGKALAAALYTDGLDPASGFNVEYMLDHLVTHPVHAQVMKDIDAKYGAKADADYHVVTLQIFKDLKAAYKL
ncbi:MAG: hypothetical protein NVSMB21_01540 [Vulcanimicrobiaceae bacterium]